MSAQKLFSLLDERDFFYPVGSRTLHHTQTPATPNPAAGVSSGESGKQPLY